MKLRLPSLEKKYLLAMSGGVDSSVLFHLLLKNEINFSVAHANFKLRGIDSDNDELFVKELCDKNNIQFTTKMFDVKAYKSNHNASTQIAARDLRYEWFEEIMSNQKFDYLLTAHHLNDSMETFFINLLRGTGINGLTGIKDNAHIIRPLINYTKEEIKSYALNNNIRWREDISNKSDLYIRNNIRHHIVPKLEEINPNFKQSYLKTIHNLEKDAELLDDYIDLVKSKISETKNDIIYFNIQELEKPNYNKCIFRLFSPYGFKSTEEINKLIKANNSAEIKSITHRIIKDRKHLILSKIEQKKDFYKIEDLETKNLPINLKFHIKDNNINNYISFDLKKIKFPLYLRTQKEGDYFFPKGMKGKSKKVSKYFKDLKLSKIEKENTWLLCDSNNQILWIVGHRQDERFLPTKNTKLWLIVEN